MKSYKLHFEFLALISLILFSTPATTQAAPAKYMGTATCASSNCHGSSTPRSGSNILQNEYTTWSKKDAHSKAWRILQTEDSKKIAHNLGIENPAKETLCLQCHSTFVTKEVQSEKFSIEDGVSCETCHGPAEQWLKSHTTSDHKENISDGMRDLTGAEKRAQFCLDCHQGTDDKFVNHRLIGAGHPRLSFELDTYSMIQPRHWDFDKDYVERKGEYSSVQAWLIGQVYIAHGMLNAMSSPERSHNGIWPELSLFNCYACHHSLSTKQWRAREYKNGPGELRLNVSSITVVSKAMAVIAPEISQKIDSVLARLHDEYKKGSAQEVLSSLNAAIFKDALSAVKKANLNSDIRIQLFKAVVEVATAEQHPQYEEAEQLAMGLSAILAADPVREKSYKTKIEAVYKSLTKPEDFVAEDFSKAVLNLR